VKGGTGGGGERSRCGQAPDALAISSRAGEATETAGNTQAGRQAGSRTELSKIIVSCPDFSTSMPSRTVPCGGMVADSTRSCLASSGAASRVAARLEADDRTMF
jgi:hypothetical protein